MKATLFTLFLPFMLFASINGPADYQIWQKASIKTAMTDQTDFILVQEARFGNDASKFYYIYLQGHFAYNPRDWITISPGYRQIYRRYPLSSNHFKPEFDAMFDVIFHTTASKWKIKDRNRVEYLLFRSNPSHWVYRNMIRFQSPWEFTSFKASPYFANEFFIRQYHGFNQNRTIVGIQEELTEHATIDLFYMARLLKRSSHWVYNNVFGVSLITKF